MPTTGRSTSLRTQLVGFVALVGLVGGGLTAGGFTSPASAAVYTPPAGVKFNKPLSGHDAQRTILTHIVRSINGVPRRGTIRIASWNIRSNAFVDALIRAHRRNVSVRVVMDLGNANAESPNPNVNRLARGLSQGNRVRPPERRSGLRKCRSSCRGSRGIAHAKFFAFSESGRVRHVVINTSANATDVSATRQWNDAYTVRNSSRLYGAFMSIFTEMWRDRAVRSPYRRIALGSLTAEFFPYQGSGATGDPALRHLNRVMCKGARNTRSGRTVIRVAMTSWHGERGKRIAWRVRRLQNAGCDIKVIYGVAGREVLRILRRGGPKPVPLRQIAQDWNEDGVYDRYLHSKVLTIRGRYGSNSRANVTVNGSANWSPAALASDEVVYTLTKRWVVTRYNDWVNRLFANPPRTSRVTTTARTGTAGPDTTGTDTTGTGTGIPEHVPLGSKVDGIDPYAEMEVG